MTIEDQGLLRPLSVSQVEAVTEAVETYERALTPEVARYLLGRGVEEGTALTHRLGVVVDPLPGHESKRGCLAIPYMAGDGTPVTLRFRCLQDHSCSDFGHGKYMTLFEDPARPYWLQAVNVASDVIHIAEGEFDAMILNQVGLPAVGFPGAHGWQPWHRRLFVGFSRVWVWGDPDEAGQRFVSKVCRSLSQAKGVRLRNGDVNEVFLDEGADGLWSLVE